MKVNFKYSGRSRLMSQGGSRILQMAPNLDRDQVSFDAPLKDPIRFREAISALHDIVISDLTFQRRDKTQYEQWKKDQQKREADIRLKARRQKQQEISSKKGMSPPNDLKVRYQHAKKRYWKSRRQLLSYLSKNDPKLWRKLVPYDPVITVADDVLLFECFSADESSYGCLSVDRESFGYASSVSRGTTNVDYSWELYDQFQKLRTYRETRFNIDPKGFQVTTETEGSYKEEKIDLPEGWLSGFMQLQSAMSIPMRRVSLSVGAVYSLLAFLKRNKANVSPRSIRFELHDGKSPKLVLEPWEKTIESPETRYAGPSDEPIRVWGRRRLLTLARVLPLIERVDVYLLGTGLPSFWIAKMGDLRLTLGLSGWTTNDWTRGSAVQMLMPPLEASDATVAKVASQLQSSRQLDLQTLSGRTHVSNALTAASLNQLALRGQVIHDLDAGVFRWRQILPMAISDREINTGHPETRAAQQLILQNKVTIKKQETLADGGIFVVAEVENYHCEVHIDSDGQIKKGECQCSWHRRFGIRNGPCRHLQAIRNLSLAQGHSRDKDWYSNRLQWSGTLDD